MAIPELTVISLGWGVQSFALACMSALDVLPPVYAAVHSDTGWEMEETYTLAKQWTPWLEDHGVRVVTVRDTSGSNQAMFDDTGQTHVPLFTLSQKDNSRGQLRRSCTQRWKIVPQRRWMSKKLKQLGLSKSEGVAERWLGITLDEVTRMRVNDVKYITNMFPFINMLDHPWTRTEVKQWLLKNNLPIPTKSSCVFCPYRSKMSWREVRQNDNNWQQAMRVDEAMRHKRPNYLSYVCSQRKPLSECDFRSVEDMGQTLLWEEEECSGMCFL